MFYSDADGTLNVNGAYITIEAQFDKSLGGGHNLTDVRLNFAVGGIEFTNSIAAFASYGAGSNPGSVGNAVDGDLSTSASLGETDGTTDWLRITLGFASTAAAISAPATR